MTLRYKTSQDGFIALISILIISMVLLFAVFAIGQQGIASRILLLDLERKAQSEELANACVQIAIIGVANDSAYIVSTEKEEVVDSDTGARCYIHSVTPSASQSTIKTCAVVPVPPAGTLNPCSSIPGPSGATTNLQVVINSTDGTIQSWQELPNL